MKGYIEIEKPSHCIECWLRNDDDNCVMQRDMDNEFIEHDSWEQQIKMCPIKNLKVHKVLKEIFDLLEEHQPRILDATCGSRMIWFDKKNPDVLYMDNRKLTDILCDGRILNVNPDVIADFRNMPFEDNTFYLVVFDPPHLRWAGKNSWVAKKYGVLSQNWRLDIAQGFKECMRVLKPNGVLIFKWNEEQIKLSEILKILDAKPLFGNRRSKTHWLVFMK